METPKQKSTIGELINKLTRKQVVILVFFICTGYFLMHSILPYIERREEKEALSNEKIGKAVLVEQLKFQKFRDSVKQREDSVKQRLTFRNIDMIYDLMKTIKKEVPLASGVSVYFLHDSGGVPVSGSPLNCTILYQETEKGVLPNKKEWQGDPLTEGFFHFNKWVYEHGEKYINDIDNYKLLTEPETLAYLQKQNTKSMYGVFLEQGTAGTYYIAFGFNDVDPFLKDPLIRHKVKRMAKKLRPLLQVRDAPNY